MAHEIFLDDVVVVKRRFEIPKRCPRCHRLFELGDVILKSQRMRPREETLHLTTMLGGARLQEVVAVKNTMEYREYPNFLVSLSCNFCNHIFYEAHRREYILEDMSPQRAQQLRGLLYDHNVKDPVIKKACFDETRFEGYTESCLACNIEADISTPEVPHPIDGRIHTCDKIPP